MSKKDEPKEEKVNQPVNAPIAPTDSATPVSRETLSHQWQANSSAVDTNAKSGYDNENLVQKLAAAEEAAKESKPEKKEKLSDEEYERRTKLDVSNPDYINKSLGK